MKEKLYKILTAVFLLQIVSTSGFGLPVDSLRIKLDHVFAHVDKSQVPTGFLEEYGAQFVNLNRFNGVLTDSNEVNALGWQYIYATVYSSRIYGTNTLPTPEANYTTFNNAAKANKGVNPVSMLTLSYSSLKPDALTNNLFTIINEQLYDVPGRGQSPYQQNITFAAAPFYETDADGELQLLFKQSLFMNNTGKTVSSIKVDFGNGTGFVTASWDNALTGTYLDTGLKKLTIQLTFTDATVLKCYCSVRILKASAGSRMMRYQPSEATIPFDPTANNHSGGDVTVQYSVNNTTTGNRKFQKPFIVVEGFDMHDAAPLLMENGYDYNNFIAEISSPDVIFNGNDFNYNLDNVAGYDLIFLNYRDGTDDILRNALLLQEVIEWVNSHKDAGADQNVVMGISMGGLVSRYCLAKMTKDGIPTQTRLLITHDSPHRGANIPLGAQYAINDFLNMDVLGRTVAGWIPQLRQVIELQTRPATVQQLIVRYDPLTSTVENNAFLAPNGSYRQMVTFNTGDNQPTYEFIATSQGSQCGEPVMAPYSSLVKTSGEAGFSFIMGAFGSTYKGEIEINALPHQTSARTIARLTIKARHKVFWIGINATLVNYQRYSPANILGYDGAAGGTQPVTRGTDLGDIPPAWHYSPAFNVMFYEYFYGFSGVQIAPEFSFVPTASALDEELNASTLFSPHVGITYTSPSDNTLLKAYLAQELIEVGAVNTSNIQHTSFMARNSRWIFDKMEELNYEIDCEDYCDPFPFSISGDHSFCTTSNPYTITGIPTGSTVTWSASPNGIVQLSSSGNSVTLTRLGDGKVTITANVDACESASPTRVVTVGKPSFVGTLFFSGTYPTLSTWNSFSGSGTGFVILDQSLGYYSYYWSLYSGSVASWTQGSQSIYGSRLDFDVGTNQPGGKQFAFNLLATNACGTLNETYYFYYSGYVGYSLKIFPNPAANNISIEMMNQNGELLPSNVNIKEIRIIDKMGVIKMKEQFERDLRKVILSVNHLPNDVYILSVFDGSKWTMQRLIIQH